ncbi:unnamed protein product [Blepharisma stoltei]|uniref:VPS9 domain-containing protein n=1 Tax=Blepharisma stoltei TaxID=1481888 RepID=A0AAU9IQE1_9CILI|nr:unnamed protein product [Blepharisma stoltei]
MEPQPRVESEQSDYQNSEETKEIKAARSLELEQSLRNFSGSTRFGQTEIGKPKVGFPSYKVVVPLSLSTSLVFDLFKNACNKHKFQISEQTQSSITAEQQPSSSIRNLFSCIVPISEERKSRNTSEVKLLIAVNERACTRVVIAKGSSGVPNKILPIIQTFRDALEKAIMKEQPSPLERSSRMPSEWEEIEPVLTSKLESSSYYQFSKVLSSQQYGVGKLVAEFIEKFNDDYEDLVEGAALVPKPLEDVKKIIEETVEALFTHFNLSNTSSQKVMQFCRPAVERYIYSKLIKQLLSMYGLKYQSINQRFQDRRDFFHTKISQELMQSLELKQKYRLNSSEPPYIQAIETLNSIGIQHTPLGKINCLLQTATLMKTAVVDYWKGKEELETMDDQLPVIIYIVSQTTVQDLPSDLNFLQDYIHLGFGFDNEQRLLINFDGAVKYIADEWNF